MRWLAAGLCIALTSAPMVAEVTENEDRKRGLQAVAERASVIRAELAHVQAELRRRAAVVEVERRWHAYVSQVSLPPALQAIAECESHGDPRAVGGGGLYRGKYQLARSTWAGLGGSGDPAGAPEAEQDRRAKTLYAREGSSPWGACSG